LGFPGGFADFCGQVERELRDLSGFVAERVRTPVKERGLGAGSLLRRKTPPVTLSSQSVRVSNSNQSSQGLLQEFL
jgi:hypothetical protein